MLKERLDPNRKALAIQDFRDLSQGRQESVANFILSLEKLFIGHMGVTKYARKLAMPYYMPSFRKV